MQKVVVIFPVLKAVQLLWELRLFAVHCLQDQIWRGAVRVFVCVNREWYCWWLKSYTSWYGKIPIIYRILYIPGGAGFQPSIVLVNIYVKCQSIDPYWKVKPNIPNASNAWIKTTPPTCSLWACLKVSSCETSNGYLHLASICFLCYWYSIAATPILMDVKTFAIWFACYVNTIKHISSYV